MGKKSKDFDVEKFCENRDHLRTISRWSITEEELLNAYEAGVRDFNFVSINSCNFSKKILNGIQLKSAYIENCDFTNSQLNESNFSGANITKSNFSVAYLSESDFNSVAMDSCLLTGCKMEYVKAVRSFFSECIFISAKLDGSDFSCATFYRINLDSSSCRNTNFQEADFNMCNFTSAFLHKTSFLMAHLENVVFLKALICFVNFLDAPGLYSVFSMSLSSRKDNLYGSISIVNNKLALRFWAGCKTNLTEKELIEFIETRHQPDSINAIQYKTALKTIKSMFKNDVAAGTWDYHLTKYNVKYVE